MAIHRCSSGQGILAFSRKPAGVRKKKKAAFKEAAFFFDDLREEVLFVLVSHQFQLLPVFVFPHLLAAFLHNATHKRNTSKLERLKLIFTLSKQRCQ
jgi:hypothetical protein